MRVHSFAILLAACLLGAACRSTPTTPRGLYRQLRSDFASSQGTGGFRASVLERVDEHYSNAMDMHRGGGLETSEDKLYVAAVLSTSDDLEHLEVSKELARQSAELGDKRAWKVLAESTDKALLVQGKKQLYGTQLVYSFALSRWSLYAVDPRTTDAERERMGLPTLAELEARADERNAAPITDLLRQSQSHRR